MQDQRLIQPQRSFFRAAPLAALSAPAGLALIVLVAFALRVAFGLGISAEQALVDDSPWYLQTGEKLLTDTLAPGDVVDAPPLYALAAGGAKLLFGVDGAVAALRLVQSALGALLAALVYRITLRLNGSSRAGVAAALGIALNPLFVIDNNQIVSETLFIFLMVWAISIYVSPDENTTRKVAASGALLGLATLTRAVLVAFPLGLALHLLLTCGWRRGLRAAALLLLAYGAVMGTWTVYNAVKFNRFQFGARGASDLLLTGTLGQTGTQAVDQTYAELTGSVPSGAARDAAALRTLAQTVQNDPLSYVAQRFGQLGEALLQPHHTPFFAGPSLKDEALAWLREDRSLGGLSRLMSDPTFLPKALFYVAHWSALLLGAVGLWRTRRNWLAYAPVSGLIAYFLLVHLLLLAIPRYLFPITPALWVFAGVALDGFVTRFRRSRTGDLQRRPDPAQ